VVCVPQPSSVVIFPDSAPHREKDFVAVKKIIAQED
jgi:hypothetical protein